MENYPSNSHKKVAAKIEATEPKNIERVTSGEVVRRKKPIGKKFAETFLGSDGKTVWQLVLFDVVIPKTKEMIQIGIGEAVEQMLYPGTKSRHGVGGAGGNPFGGRGPIINYSGSSKNTTVPGRSGDSRTISKQARASHDFGEVILETRAEAQEVLDRMFDLYLKYEEVKVSELYGLLGITADYTDQKYGWTDISGTKIERVRGGGYLLDLPPTEPLV